MTGEAVWKTVRRQILKDYKVLEKKEEVVSDAELKMIKCMDPSHLSLIVSHI